MNTVDEEITVKKPTAHDHPPKRETPRHAEGHQDEPHRRLHQPERPIAVWGPLLVVMVIAAFIIFGVWLHVKRVQEEKSFAKDNSQVSVNTTTVHRNQKAVNLVLPGSVQANQATTLFARTNGYLGKWFVDIGDNVKQGQVLAVIETPDVEQQLRQAQGTLNQAKASFEIARVTAVRWQELFDKKVVSAQENDQQQSTYQNAAAAVTAAQANVNLLQQQLSFNQIVAPFDGRITFRFLDVGALVSAGSGSAGTSIYSLQQTDPLLIYVYVPQSDSPLVHVGDKAKLVVREYPGRDFTAAVTRTAGAIDQTSRTLLTELQIPNPDGTLFAGMYGEIQFSLKDTSNAPVIVPANAYMFRTEGAEVAVIRDKKVHWQTIRVGRDYGTELEALTGLKDGDHVVVNPTDDLAEGLEVTEQQAKPAGAATAQASGSGNTTGGGNAQGAGQQNNAQSGGQGGNAQAGGQQQQQANFDNEPGGSKRLNDVSGDGPKNSNPGGSGELGNSQGGTSQPIPTPKGP